MAKKDNDAPEIVEMVDSDGNRWVKQDEDKDDSSIHLSSFLNPAVLLGEIIEAATSSKK